MAGYHGDIQPDHGLTSGGYHVSAVLTGFPYFNDKGELGAAMHIKQNNGFWLRQAVPIIRAAYHVNRSQFEIQTVPAPNGHFVDAVLCVFRADDQASSRSDPENGFCGLFTYIEAEPTVMSVQPRSGGHIGGTTIVIMINDLPARRPGMNREDLATM
jgi:hypothetical protein